MPLASIRRLVFRSDTVKSICAVAVCLRALASESSSISRPAASIRARDLPVRFLLRFVRLSRGGGRRQHWRRGCLRSRGGHVKQTRRLGGLHLGCLCGYSQRLRANLGGLLGVGNLLGCLVLHLFERGRRS